MSLELRAKNILETGNIKAFEDFLIENSDKIDVEYLFEERASFLIILVQTYRKAESLVIDRSHKVVIDDYKNCLQFLVELGCDINIQDVMGRTFAHWTILLHCLELLSVALSLGCDSFLQDLEGETIVHLAIQYNDQMALETIKLYSNNPDVFESPSETSGATPLIYAVQMGLVDIIKKLLQLNVNIDSQENNKYKRTALHYALFTENEEIFTILLKNKAKSDIKDYDDKSVIDRVAEHPKDNFLRIITHYSSSDIFSPNTSNNSVGFSSIIVACKNSDFNMLCSLLDKESDQSAKEKLLVEDNESRTPLHHCVDNSDTKCAEKLIELQKDLIDKRDKNGFTVLHLATIANNVKLVQLLVRNGCNTNVTDNDGHTCLDWAVVCCAVELIDLFNKTNPELINITDSHGASPLHYATQSFLSPEGSVQGPIVLEKLLKHNKIDINCVDYDSRTPLLWAASLGITDCCQILLENCADINHRDSNGLSVLHCAASRGHYDVVDLVVNMWSMPVDVEDNNLCTPLFYAVTLKHMSIIHFLVEQRSNPNHQDIKGRSVAHCAALKGHCDVLDIIRKTGGSLTLKNNNGDLPLHEAAETGKLEVCKLIVEKMAECNEIQLINDLNKSGYSPLHKAAQNNHYKICKFLIDNGASVNLITRPVQNNEKRKFTPLDLATDCQTITLLKDHNGLSSKELQTDSNVDEEDKNAMNPIVNGNEGRNDSPAQQENEEINKLNYCDPDNDLFDHSVMPLRKELNIAASLQNQDNFNRKLTSASKKFENTKQKKLNYNSNGKNVEKNSQGLPAKTVSSGNKNKTEKMLLKSNLSKKSINSEDLETSKNVEINKQSSQYKKQRKSNVNPNSIKNELDNLSIESPSPEISFNKNKTDNNVGNHQNVEISQNDYHHNEDKFDDNQEKESKCNKTFEMPSLGKELEGKKVVEKKKRKKLTSGKSYTSDKSDSISKLEGKRIESNKLANSKLISDAKGKFKTKSALNRSNFEIIENGIEIKSLSYTNLTRDSNPTTSSSISSLTSNNRKSTRSKSSNLSSKVVESVKQYENVRNRMRLLSDQRRTDMFQGYSKSIKLSKLSIKRTPRPVNHKKDDEQKINPIELPELTFFNSSALQNSLITKKRVLNSIPQNKTEQIKLAYDYKNSVDTLTLF